MVILSRILRYATGKKVTRKYLRGRFIDSLRVYVKGGGGGMGLPKYGGVGGKGGDVYVAAKEGTSLKDITKQFVTKRVVAGNGRNSQHQRILGEPGSDVVIEAPVGVTLIDEHGRTVGELNTDGSRVLVAHGGPGGSAISSFTGLKGQSFSLTLDLKLIADVGLVGFPNAGKSSLLKAASKAKPKIASYPFTTIRPNVGVVEYPDYRQVSMADLPGLVEGAHANVGMGHRFLKHVERTKLLLLVVDVNGFQLSHNHEPRTCLENVILLNKELELYKEELLAKPAMIVINKMDTKGADKIFDNIKHQLEHLAEVALECPVNIRPLRALRFESILPISALRGDGIQEVKDVVRQILDDASRAEQTVDTARLVAQLRDEMRERGPLVT